MKEHYSLETVECIGCGKKFESLYYIETGDYDMNFCSKDCAIINYSRLHKIIERGIKLKRIKDTINES